MVYTDAEGSGHIAAALFDGAQTPAFVPHTHAPCWMRMPTVGVGIFEFELLAICLGVMLALTHSPNRPILVCADKLGARGAVVRGTCRARVGRALSSYLWKMASTNPTLIWIEFAKSNLNVYDAPSRFCVENKPANAFTRGPLCKNPSKSFNDLGSEENLLMLGVNNKPTNMADLHCPVHDRV